MVYRGMTTDLNPNTMAAWVSLIRASERAVSQVEAVLKYQNLPPLSWYDALIEVEKSGATGVRPYELRERLLMPQYGTSRLLARIEKAGYIQRVPCSMDGRGHVVKITNEGKAVRKRMWPIYSNCIKNMVETNLTHLQADALRSLVDCVAVDKIR